jgi:hypothetical protein
MSNNEQGTPNIEGRRRFAPCICIKKDRACGAPSFDIPCSIFVIRYSFFSFPSSFFKKNILPENGKISNEITHYPLPTTYYLLPSSHLKVYNDKTDLFNFN